MANVFAQSQALAFGQAAPAGEPYRNFAGNRPSNTILAERLTPAILGALVALYEHSVFTQGVVWNINPFDQFGVQLGKVLAEKLLPSLGKDAPLPETDSSTAALLRRYREG
jgi:glucose-6-phosphate isomerase